jgi:cytochrome c-type biogenesis protein CcmH/NrfG
MLASVLAAWLAAQSTLIEQGRVALDHNDPRTAVTVLEAAVAQSPQDAEGHYLLGIAYGRLAERANLFRRASLAGRTRQEFERAVSLDPNHLDARFSLVQYYMIAPNIYGGSESKALEQADEIAKRDAAYGHRALAFIHTRQKNYKAALSELEAAVALDPNDMSSWFEIGHIAAISGLELSRGEEALLKYVAHTPAGDDPPLDSAYDWLSKIYEREGRSSDAVRAEANAQRLAVRHGSTR